jgi:selenocysteine lyase/cysteine desulfurase
VGSALDNVKVLQRLLEKKILVSVRYTSNIRVSCHFYNSPEDIETLLTQLRRLLQ